MNSVPFCKDCKYFWTNGIAPEPYRCSALQVTTINIVTGERYSANAALQRSQPAKHRCGPEGKFFEPTAPELTTWQFFKKLFLPFLK